MHKSDGSAKRKKRCKLCKAQTIFKHACEILSKQSRYSWKLKYITIRKKSQNWICKRVFSKCSGHLSNKVHYLSNATVQCIHTYFFCFDVIAKNGALPWMTVAPVKCHTWYSLGKCKVLWPGWWSWLGSSSHIGLYLEEGSFDVH